MPVTQYADFMDAVKQAAASAAENKVIVAVVEHLDGKPTFYTLRRFDKQQWAQVLTGGFGAWLQRENIVAWEVPDDERPTQEVMAETIVQEHARRYADEYGTWTGD